MNVDPIYGGNFWGGQMVNLLDARRWLDDLPVDDFAGRKISKLTLNFYEVGQLLLRTISP